MSDEDGDVKQSTECQPCTPCPKIIKFWILGLVVLNTIIVVMLAWQWISRIFAD